MVVGICGLGLIGGSMAKVYRAAGHTVYGADRDKTTMGYALLSETVNGTLTDETIPQCELLFIALYPEASAEYLRSISPKIPKSALVIDLCGTKKRICETGFTLAERYGYTFVGGHPMAGKHFSGIKYSSEKLFAGAPMVIVPPRFDDIALLDRVKKALVPAGFGRISITTAEEHDRMIAFTSQLAHAVSNAYVKSPTARGHKGFSAGSYKDLTRVAWLNENMWSELFLENSDNMIAELDCIIKNLSEYRDAIADGDKDRLCQLLRDGRIAKEEIDGKSTK